MRRLVTGVGSLTAGLELPGEIGVAGVVGTVQGDIEVVSMRDGTK